MGVEYFVKELKYQRETHLYLCALKDRTRRFTRWIYVKCQREETSSMLLSFLKETKEGEKVLNLAWA